jgi:CheY-like chemotaxis protein
MLFYQAMFSVLVADDDPQLLEMVCEAFTRMNANVVRASSGADLIEQLATAGPFDLVVISNQLARQSLMASKIFEGCVRSRAANALARRTAHADDRLMGRGCATA